MCGGWERKDGDVSASVEYKAELWREGNMEEKGDGEDVRWKVQDQERTAHGTRTKTRRDIDIL